MKRHLPAGHLGDDLKTLRKQIVTTEADVGKYYEAEADKLLKESKNKMPTSVPALQGGRPESNRRKF